MLIAGLQKSSLVDYPEKIAAVVFTPGCNFRCGYCHNPGILTMVPYKKLTEEDDVLSFLKKRAGKLDAVVVSGGEPTLMTDLEEFAKKVKDLGYLLKLDTNGTNPETIKSLVNKGLLDYIAMDIKAPLKKYQTVASTETNTEKIAQSIEYIMNCGIDYEFRTTVVKSQLDEKDFDSIGKLIKGAKRYYLQKFVNTRTSDPNFSEEKTYSDIEFEKITSILKNYLQYVSVR